MDRQWKLAIAFDPMKVFDSMTGISVGSRRE
jgi:hypothetical protein